MPTIAILIFPGVQALDVSGPMDVFAEANSFLPAEQQYAIEVLGTQEGLLRCSNGLSLAAHRHYAQANDAYDLLLVAGGPGLPAQPYDAALSAWLARAAGKAGRHGSICNGAFLLGHAGLLDGKKVATHWNDAAALAARFPLAQVDADSIYVHDGKLVSSAGVTAGIDLALSLLADDGGAPLALQVARRLVVYTQRQGGQSQFSPHLTPVVDAASPVAQAQRGYWLPCFPDSVASIPAIPSLVPSGCWKSAAGIAWQTRRAAAGTRRAADLPCRNHSARRWFSAVRH